MLIRILLILLASITGASANQLKDFQTDYCTYFPEGTLRNPGLWQQCCFDHDLRYWFGGTKNDRLKADLKLRECVEKKAGSFMGHMMFFGIRAGRFSPLKHKYKWSWGWDEKRAGELTAEEKAMINQRLKGLSLDPAYLLQFKAFYGL